MYGNGYGRAAYGGLVGNPIGQVVRKGITILRSVADTSTLLLKSALRTPLTTKKDKNVLHSKVQNRHALTTNDDKHILQ